MRPLQAEARRPLSKPVAGKATVLRRVSVFVAVMILAWGGVASVKIFMAMRDAEKARSLVARATPFDAEVLSLTLGGRRNANGQVRLLARSDPQGKGQAAVLIVSPDAFEDAARLKAGDAVQLYYDPLTRQSTQRLLADKQASWRWWVLR